jgi:hypothetical protein
MLELGSSGSARGVCSNVHPSRDPGPKAVLYGRRSQTNCPKLPLCQQAVKLSLRSGPKSASLP